MQPFTAGDLIGRTFALLRAGAGRSIAALAILSAAATIVDSNYLDEGAAAIANLALAVAAVAVQYWLCRLALHDVGASPPDQGRFGAYFGFLIVSNIAILFGLLVVVVPGVILIVRWWLAGPILLDSDAAMTDALKESWHATAGRFWPIFATLAAVWIPASILILAAESSIRLDADPLPFLAINLGIYAALIASWHSAVAAYSFSTGPTDNLSNVFA